MKVKLSYNDISVILDLLDKKLEGIKEECTRMKNEVIQIEKEQGTCWEYSMEENSGMRYEELREALRNDYKRQKELEDLIKHLRSTR